MQLNQMKKGARLINCARGGLVDENACRAALETNHLAGAAFDVFVEEPATDNVLFNAPNFIATPHLGASTKEAQENVAIQIAEQMSNYLKNGAVVNAINFPNLTSEEAPLLKPYIRLSYLIGSFLGQVSSEGIKNIKLEMEGKAASLKDEPIMANLLTGILEPNSDAVNSVNSREMATSKGLDFTTIKHKRRCDYETLLTASIEHTNGIRSISGTLLEVICLE